MDDNKCTHGVEYGGKCLRCRLLGDDELQPYVAALERVAEAAMDYQHSLATGDPTARAGAEMVKALKELEQYRHSLPEDPK